MRETPISSERATNQSVYVVAQADPPATEGLQKFIDKGGYPVFSFMNR